MSLADRLNKKIEIWTVGPGQDAAGQPIETPVKVAGGVSAEVLDKDGDLVVDGDQVQRTAKTNITIRQRELPANITVRYRGYEYRVDGPPLGTNNRTLLLACIKMGKVVTP